MKHEMVHKVLKPRGLKMMTMTMAPSTTQLRSFSSGATDGGMESTSKRAPMPHPEDPLIYKIPKELHPTYRPLPILLRLVVYFSSLWLSALATWKNLTFLQPLAIFRGIRGVPPVTELVSFVFKTLAIALTFQVSFQEIIAPPSRIAVGELVQKYHLPSSFSKYEKVAIPDGVGAAKPIGVHYLQYTSSKYKDKATNSFDAIYFHHGFGASALSWLPAYSLVDRLGARIGLGHDMVGFGLTDRQKHLKWYTTDVSARISNAVLSKELDGYVPTNGKIALFGHSLGAIGVLKMALALPKDVSKAIILSSPALGLTEGFADKGANDKTQNFLWRIKKRLTLTLQNIFFFPVGGYILRRVVGTKNSWRTGLKAAAWGDPDALKNSDVLRYQWPSIIKGWERGLLQFSLAQRREDDVLLLRKVLDLPNTTVSVIVGTKDKVIQPKITYQFLSNFPSDAVKLVKLDNLGHNAFEEDTNKFSETVENLILNTTNTSSDD